MVNLRRLSAPLGRRREYEHSLRRSEFVNYSFDKIDSVANDRNDYIVLLKVGEEPNTRTFRTRSSTLIARSSYFETALSKNWLVMRNGVAIFKKPNISPKVFEIMLQYLQTGKMSLVSKSPLFILDVLVGADELCLQELFDYLQDYLLEHYTTWLEENFALVHAKTKLYDAFTKFKEFCDRTIEYMPELVLAADDFTSLDGDLLHMMLERNDIGVHEVQLWQHMIDWGIAQTPELPSGGPQRWHDADFAALRQTLAPYVPLIRFLEMPASEFYRRVYPYRNLLSVELLQNVLAHHHQPQRPPSRHVRCLLTNQHLNWISKFFGGKDPSDSELSADAGDNPYRFRLILHGTRDGFSAKTFHRLCDNRGPTVVVMKVHGTREIIGGFNPLPWESSNLHGTTHLSFIFSLIDDKLEVSRINHCNIAVHSHEKFGPIFGEYDLVMYGNFKKTKECFCRQFAYARPIRENGSQKFSVDQFQVLECYKASG